MKKYKIGEFAREMGVSQDMIKHYEKYGIIKPEIDEQTNYRYFNIQQGEKIIESKKYRNLGFTIKESADLIFKKDFKGIKQELINKQREMEFEVEHLQAYLTQINQLLKIADRFEHNIANWEIVHLDGFYFLKQTDNYEFSQDETVKERVREWLDLLPITNQAVLVARNSFYTEPFNHQWGFSISCHKAKEINLDVSCAKLLPAGKYLVFASGSLQNQPMSKERFHEVRVMMEQFQLIYGEELLMECIFKSHEGNEGFSHFIIYIPIIEPGG